MKKYFTNGLLIFMSLGLISTVSFSKSKSRRTMKKSSYLDTLSQKYRKGELTEEKMWKSLSSYSSKIKTLPRNEKVRLLQTQSDLLFKDGYPILASIYASQAIRSSKKPFSAKVKRSWEILREVSEKTPIQNLLESLALKLKIKTKAAPSFGTDWFYYVGNAYERQNSLKKSIEAYSKVKLTDKYYFPAKFHEAVVRVRRNDHSGAEAALKNILYSTSQDLSTLSTDERSAMANMAKMALGRVYYEQKKFEKSFRAYRSVKKESVQYYDALFEQSWAFFMAGYPNHALGAIHSLQSPFFNDRYNPEASMLKSIVYFWMCQYDESKFALQEFKDNYENAIDGLKSILDRKTLQSETAYQLFENYIIGVSSESLEIPREIIKTAVTQDSMMQVRNQYASILEEKRRLNVKGIYKSQSSASVLMGYLENWENHLRKEIGERFLTELGNMKQSFDSLNEQAQFLELELIMSEKDHILGKELHASNKMTTVSSDGVYGWGKQSTQSWAGSEGEEYWWDEVGYYIYQVSPQCNIK